MQNPASANHCNGRQVSFTAENKRAPNYIDWTKYRVDSQQGKAIFGYRMSVVEPVFGYISDNKRLNRFSLRSKKKVQVSGSCIVWSTTLRRWRTMGS
jgi:hypothetical protein